MEGGRQSIRQRVLANGGGGSVSWFCFFLLGGGGDDVLCFKIHYHEARRQEVVDSK